MNMMFILAIIFAATQEATEIRNDYQTLDQYYLTFSDTILEPTEGEPVGPPATFEDEEDNVWRYSFDIGDSCERSDLRFHLQEILVSIAPTVGFAVFDTLALDNINADVEIVSTIDLDEDFLNALHTQWEDIMSCQLVLKDISTQYFQVLPEPEEHIVGYEFDNTASRRVLTDIPESDSIPDSELGSILNQGAVGSCVAHTYAQLLRWYHRKRDGFEGYFSPKFIYNMRALDGHVLKSGMQAGETLAFMERYGVAEERDAPYWSGCEWYGTSPFCDGECPSGKTLRRVSDSGDGATCWTGSKVYCCNLHVSDSQREDSISETAKQNALDFRMDFNSIWITPWHYTSNIPGLKTAVKENFHKYGPAYISVHTREGWSGCQFWNGKGKSGGHAMVLYGYGENGVHIRNSWGSDHECAKFHLTWKEIADHGNKIMFINQQEDARVTVPVKMLQTTFPFLFDGCCRGPAATKWTNMGQMTHMECEALCTADKGCNAIETNGWLTDPIDGSGLCYLFFGYSDGDITNGNCDTSGDQKCFRMPVEDMRCQWSNPIMGSIAGHNIGCHSGTLDECKQLCDEDPNCHSLDVRNSDGLCCLGDCKISDGGCENDNDMEWTYYECITGESASKWTLQNYRGVTVCEGTTSKTCQVLPDSYTLKKNFWSPVMVDYNIYSMSQHQIQIKGKSHYIQPLNGCVPPYWGGKLQEESFTSYDHAMNVCKAHPECGAVYTPGGDTKKLRSGVYEPHQYYLMRLSSSVTFCPACGFESHNKFYKLEGKTYGGRTAQCDLVGFNHGRRSLSQHFSFEQDETLATWQTRRVAEGETCFADADAEEGCGDAPEDFSNV